jgi:hypothetical protein
MDARTGVEQSRGVFEPRAAFDPKGSLDGVAVAEAAAASPTPLLRAKEGARLSLDPMRATDRYRLVMPYSARI